MAFGLELGGNYGKLALSLFRLIAIGFLIYLIREFIKSEVRFGILLSFSLILAGAIGNIIDSAFYGMLFSASYQGSEIARIFPPEGGYAGFLHGKVVDMFYFPMFQGIWPDWMPFVGGKYYQFFQPVFNLADVAISVGVLNILLFQRSFFFKEMEEKRNNKEQLGEEASIASDLQIASTNANTNNSAISNNLPPATDASNEA